MNARIYSLDLGWLDRALTRLRLWRDRRRTQRRAARRVGLLDSGELVLVDARGRATVIDEVTVRTIDDTLWGRSLLAAHAAAEGLRRGDVADTVARAQRSALSPTMPGACRCALGAGMRRSPEARTPMHAARIHASARLQRVHALLADGQPRSTLDIVRLAGVCAVNSIVAELRANGVRVACQRSGDTWWYWLERADAVQESPRG